MGSGSRKGDDIDDFMANILGGGNSRPSARTSDPKKPSSNRPVYRAEKQEQSARDDEVFESIQMEEKKPKKHRRNKGRLLKTFKGLALATLLVSAAIGLFFLAKGPLSSLLGPSSPFSQEIKDNAGITLYFPSKPPAGFKIEVGSISQPENGVVMYAITNDGGKRIVLNQQKKPDGISLDPLYAALRDIKSVQTKYGEVKIGTSEEGITVGNVFIKDTWIIINSSDGSLTTDSLKTIVNGLKS